MTTEIVLPHAPAPLRIGQGTAVEQSRAQAEVMAAMLAAKQAPRDEMVAQQRMEQVCKMTALAERAFFRFPRAGSTVSGPSVHLARELARCWGNLHYEVKELSRDDTRGESEMQAIAWDLEVNARSSAIFIVPHKRDAKKDGKPAAVPLTEMRDVYENNANAGARRLRECIFAVLPLWYVEAAKDLCAKTLKEGGGVPLPQRIARVVGLFEAIGVQRGQLETKVGRPTSAWNEHDVAALQPIYQSISRGEVTKEDEFPVAVVSGDEIAAAATAARSRRAAGPRKPAEKPAADPPVPADDDEAERLREQQEMEAEIAAEDDALREVERSES